MSPNITAYTTNDLKKVLLNLGFEPGNLTSDGEAIEYTHPTRTRNFSRNNSIFLPVDNFINRPYSVKLLDDLLSFGFTDKEIEDACEIKYSLP